MFRLRTVLASVVIAGGAAASAQVCVVAEPATPLCTSPRVISGAPGHHVVMMDVSTSASTSTLCGVSTSHNVWFEVTPIASGPMTITTCHPNTAYDTVLQVYSGGDAGCDFLVEEACNDDDPFGQGCTSVCGDPSPRSSSVTIQATAGTRYRFVVGGFGASIVAPCQPCLGVRVTLGAPCGDPPDHLDATLAAEIPGDPGVYTRQVDVTDAIKLPSEPNPSCVGPAIGHSVWYRTTPTRDGRLTVGSCTPTTNFDTVLGVYQDAGGGLLLAVDCSDDFPDAACINACDPTPRGSLLSTAVSAGGTYLIQVGSYNDNTAGCAAPLCLGLEVLIEDICDLDLSAPEVGLTAPDELTSGCVCPGVAIEGWAYDPNGTFDTWTLEYRPPGSATWTTIATGASETPPSGGVLANWNAAVPQGYYVLRLRADNTCARSSAVERVVWVDTAFDSLTFSTADVLGGDVCLAGTAFDSFCFDFYTAEYRPAGGGTWLPVDAPSYGTTAVNQTLAVWNTTVLPDGAYELMVRGWTDCGHSASQTRPVTVDNTAPVVIIAAPLACEPVAGVVPIIGTVSDANLASWSLQFTGGGVGGWVTIATGSGPVSNGLLANWDVSGLPPCGYTLRLVAVDEATRNCNAVIHNTAEATTSVQIESCPADIDGSGTVDLSDLAILLSVFGAACP